jgi:hypothetical protein
MNISDRIVKYLDLKGISKSKFYAAMGVSNGFLDKRPNIGADKVEKIIEIYTDLNLNWLITGKGEMLNPTNEMEMQKELDEGYHCKFCEIKDKLIDQQAQTIEVLQEMISMLKKRNGNGNNNDNHEPIRQTG